MLEYLSRKSRSIPISASEHVLMHKKNGIRQSSVVQSSGGSRISQTETPTPRWGRHTIIWPNFPRKWHKNERNWTESGFPGTPALRSTNAVTYVKEMATSHSPFKALRTFDVLKEAHLEYGESKWNPPQISDGTFIRYLYILRFFQIPPDPTDPYILSEIYAFESCYALWKNSTWTRKHKSKMPAISEGENWAPTNLGNKVVYRATTQFTKSGKGVQNFIRVFKKLQKVGNIANKGKREEKNKFSRKKKVVLNGHNQGLLDDHCNAFRLS